MFVGVVTPAVGSSMGLEVVNVLGGGFDPTAAGRTRVLFGDQQAMNVLVANKGKVHARTPLGYLVDARGKPLTNKVVDVTVQLLDANGLVVDSATKVNAFTYVRRYQPSFEVVTAALLDQLRSIFAGTVVLDVQADFTRDGVIVAQAELPALLVDGPSLIRDEFRSARPLNYYSAGNDVVRTIPPWVRRLQYDLVVTDTDRRRAQQAVGQLVRWVDAGPAIEIFGRRVEVVEALGDQFRSTQAAGQDYTADRVVSIHGAIELVNVELPGEQWDQAYEVTDPTLETSQLGG